MLTEAGLVDDRWYTEESSTRGQAIHQLTAGYDNGIYGADVNSLYRDRLLAWIRVKQILGVKVLAVEEPKVHPTLRFGGRPDRVVEIAGKRGVLELKSGVPEDVHQIQTALQAILEAPYTRLSPEALCRWCVYLKPGGKFSVDEHERLTDYVIAQRVIQQTTGGFR
jgi:hypothetical protein